MNTTLALLTALLFTLPATLRAADFSVDARRGDDGNPGTLAQPVKTIAKAAEAAQAGDTVRIATGVYREAVRIEQSGMAENAEGALFHGPDQVARRCVFQDNGQDGFTAVRAHRLLMTDCLTRNNNTKNFNRGWGGGGNKLCLSRGVVIEKSQFIANRGIGIWFDIGNEDCTVRHCLIADNEDAGIFYEISYGLHAHDNVIVGNGLLSGPGAWGANGAIALSSSPRCVIERNLMLGNQEGVQFREQPSTTARIDGKKGSPEEWIWNHDQVIQRNLIAYNLDAQVWGWFDVDDERHWPASLQKADGQDKKQPKDDIAAEYQAKRKDNAPVGLSLEKLNLVFDGNLYALHPGQGLFHWGAAWDRIVKYSTLDAVRNELRLETGRVAESLPLANVRVRDFRLPADSPALKEGCYPRGEVPGAKLGASDR